MLTFDPPLGQTTHVKVPRASEHTLSLRFRLRGDSGDEGSWQVWTNAGSDGEEWKAVDFKPEEIPEKEEGDIVIQGSSNASAPLLIALISFPARPNREISYTFRQAHPNDDITWCGNGSDNGTVIVEEGEGEEDTKEHVPKAYQELNWTAVGLNAKQEVVALRDEAQEVIAIFAAAPNTNFAILDDDGSSSPFASFVAYGPSQAISLPDMFKIAANSWRSQFSSTLSVFELTRKMLPKDLETVVHRAGSGIARERHLPASITIFRPFCNAERATLDICSSASLLLLHEMEVHRVEESFNELPIFLERGSTLGNLTLLPLTWLSDIRVAVPNAEPISAPDLKVIEAVAPPEAPEDPKTPTSFDVFNLFQQLLACLWILLSRLQRPAIEASQSDDDVSVSSEPSEQIQTPKSAASPQLVSVSSFQDIPKPEEEAVFPPKPLGTSASGFFRCQPLSTLYVTPNADLDHLRLFVQRDDEWQQADFEAREGPVMTELKAESESGICILRIDYSG